MHCLVLKCSILQSTGMRKSDLKQKVAYSLLSFRYNLGSLCPFLFCSALCMPKALFLSNHKMKQSNPMMMNRIIETRKSSKEFPKDTLTWTGLIASVAALAFSPSSSSNRLSWLCSVVLLCGVFATGEASPFSLLPPGGQQSVTKQCPNQANA